MRNLFAEHFEYSDEEIDLLWESCIFAFDTNILLGLYRYSDETKSELLNILDSIKDRILLPSHVAKEFFKNRFKVIGSQIKIISETESSIDNLTSKLKENKAHPHLPQDLSNSLEEVFLKLSEHLDSSKKLLEKKLTNDDIKYKLAEIFEGKISKEFSNDELKEIISKGKDRLNSDNPPPGYKDYELKIKKNKETTKHDEISAFGDLIIWNQLIEYAKDNGKSIIFITDDIKEDWQQRERGKSIGPRPELKKEFKEKSGHNFQMHTSFRFLELFNKHAKNKIDVKEDTINEVKEAYISDKTTPDNKEAHKETDCLNEEISEKTPELNFDLHRLETEKQILLSTTIREQIKIDVGITPESEHKVKKSEIKRMNSNIKSIEKEISMIKKKSEEKINKDSINSWLDILNKINTK